MVVTLVAMPSTDALEGVDMTFVPVVTEVPVGRRRVVDEPFVTSPEVTLWVAVKVTDCPNARPVVGPEQVPGGFDSESQSIAELKVFDVEGAVNLSVTDMPLSAIPPVSVTTNL